MVESKICELPALTNRRKYLLLLLHASKRGRLPSVWPAIGLLHVRQAAWVLLRHVSGAHLRGHGVLRRCDGLLIVVLTAETVWVGRIHVSRVSTELGHLRLTLEHHGARQHWQT